MADGFVILTNEIDAFAVRLGPKVNVRILENVVTATGVTMNKMKAEARNSVRSTFGHIPALPYSINYDVNIKLIGIEGELGYDRDHPQGNMGHIIEFGGSTGYASPNAPQRNLAKALAIHTDDYVSGIRKAFIDGLDW